MTIRNRTVREVAVPPSPLAEASLERVDFSDAYAAPLPAGSDPDPQAWVDRVFHQPPRWVGAAMRARNVIAERLGLEAPASTRGGFPVLAREEREILLGMDDKHLDFRVSVRVEAGTLIVATRVRLRNRLGRVYFAPVKRVHPIVVRAMMARALLVSEECPSSSPSIAA